MTERNTLRKFKRERMIGRYIANPTVAALDRLGIRTALVSELETTGAKTGLPRRVPVTASFDDKGAWIICQHGPRAGWARNITADPRVRLRRGDRWYTGTAKFVPDDDVVARARSFATGRIARPVLAWTIKALETEPISVRVTFSAADPD
ncbi:nitroreductase family deazaflavin-dependent oxidoreductase [Nocardia amikacinitolerans]|uniref:nitroreductase family deazaflavin-dependent oxidoreductase n=1 Tax=Nocardia amikacinitolerans TaxID=756689 RepID=UPI0020A3A477|nr:nitroreductase family deazaflavin-dependent oxidoreductase [Nocardia amikacinitolerans]MCP2275066.1 deazaflavin-dependent oxidoreductase, nitroreductase family [Nocardia amikacinitolerans]